MDVVHVRMVNVDSVGLARPILMLTCAKYSSDVPDSLSTTSVRSREELEGRWPGVLKVLQF